MLEVEGGGDEEEEQGEGNWRGEWRKGGERGWRGVGTGDGG